MFELFRLMISRGWSFGVYGCEGGSVVVDICSEGGFNNYRVVISGRDWRGDEETCVELLREGMDKYEESLK